MTNMEELENFYSLSLLLTAFQALRNPNKEEINPAMTERVSVVKKLTMTCFCTCARHVCMSICVRLIGEECMSVGLCVKPFNCMSFAVFFENYILIAG